MQQDERAFVRLEDGTIMERDVLRIAERITEYDPNLVIQYLDPARGGDLTDAPYRIAERCPDGMVRTVFSVWTLDESVLERIYNADTQRHSIQQILDVKNQAARDNRERRYKEQQEEVRDIISHVFNSPKGTYTFREPTHNKLVKIDDSQKRLPPGD